MDSIEIRLELFAFLDKFYPADATERPCRLQVDSGSTARSLVHNLNLPEDIPLLVYINERQLPNEEDRDLADGDTVGVVPALPGG